MHADFADWDPRTVSQGPDIVVTLKDEGDRVADAGAHLWRSQALRTDRMPASRERPTSTRVRSGCAYALMPVLRTLMCCALLARCQGMAPMLR